MTKQQILDNKEKIYKCAKSFRDTANKLMLSLSTTYNFDLETFDDFIYTLRKSHKNKGVLDENWTYFFHGSECRFENIQTGQIVEIIYVNKPEFGYLDGYFFYNYMLTTQQFKKLAVWFENYLNVWNAIEILSQEGTFTKMETVLGTRNILAL